MRLGGKGRHWKKEKSLAVFKSFYPLVFPPLFLEGGDGEIRITLTTSLICRRQRWPFRKNRDLLKVKKNLIDMGRIKFLLPWQSTARDILRRSVSVQFVPTADACAGSKVCWIGGPPRTSDNFGSMFKKAAAKKLLVGVAARPDEKGPLDAPSLKKAIFAAVTELRNWKYDSASLDFNAVISKGVLCGEPPSGTLGTTKEEQRELKSHEIVEKVVTWTALSDYTFDKYRTKWESHLNSVVLNVFPQMNNPHVSSATRRGANIAEGVALARDLGNERADTATPDSLAQRACSLFSSIPNCSCWHLGPKRVHACGMRMLEGVGAGATSRSQLVVVQYKGNAESRDYTALVGKGITFDSGGLHLKPQGSIENMHLDMMGGAAVLGTLRTLHLLRAPVNVVGVVAFAENAIGPASYRPSTILRSLKGLTVEVTNTDAEGRLVLGDALTYTQRKLPMHPSTVIDFATLTGAAVVALGNQRGALFCNDQKLKERLVASGNNVLEPLWPMPVGPEHIEAMKGKASDLVNFKDRDGGCCTAAAFLSHFVEPETRWAHVDIAGCGMKGTDCDPLGPPGFGVQLMTEYFTHSRL